MSSDSTKQPASEPASDEPNSKKVKISDVPQTKAEADKNGTNLNEAINDDDGHGESSHLDGVFDPKVAKSLEQVENIQLEICNLNEKASEEILKVEQKFNKLRRPHFEKRNELLKEIPNFWLTSLANHPVIAPMIESAEDEDCLRYMSNLDVEEFDDIKSGYKLKLHFNENPYITNNLIVKEFRLMASGDVATASTPLDYKKTPESEKLKNVVENSMEVCRRSRRPGQTQQSFFAWLVDSNESGPDEVAETLKDQIWPNPLEFFFAPPDEYGVASDEESDDEDEDEEIDDEDLDEDEEGVIVEGDFSDVDVEESGEEDSEPDDTAGDE